MSQRADLIKLPTLAPAASSSRPVLRRACACGRHTTNRQGECAECRQKRLGLQRRAVGQGPETAPPIVHDVLRSPGRPLDDATRGLMESRFGHDFSGVRLHTDGRAAESARAVNALAYTVGNHVAFDHGQYAPETSGGRGLLAHELAHVVQQQNVPSPSGAVHLGAPDSGYEREATVAAAMMRSDLMPSVTGATPTLQRQPAARITAPIPKEATVNRQGQASFQINGINVIVEPDRTSTDQAMRKKAETKFGLVLDQEAGGQFDSRSNTVTSVTPPQFHATLYTTYGPGVNPSGPVDYGRGTTGDDKQARNTTIRFHESRHGADWFVFLRQNPAPVFSGRAGMSLDDFQKAREKFHADINSYNLRAANYSKRVTDCAAGAKLPKDRGLAAICRQQRP